MTGHKERLLKYLQQNGKITAIEAIEKLRNTRLTKKVTILGETKTFYEFEKQYGIPAQLMHSRYNKGFRDEKVIYNGNLGSFKTTKLKRDAKGRFLKKEAANEI